MRRLPILAWAATALLAGCSGTSELSGGTSTGGGGSGGGGSGGGGTTTLSLGSGSGSTFKAGSIAVSTTSLSAGGSTSLQVSLVDQTNALYTTPTLITFSSPCYAQGLATIVVTGSTSTPPNSITTSSGSASATYVAHGCNGSDTITAQATANSQNLSATGTVTVAQAAIGSIAFISAKPASITLKGVGSASGSATSTVVFKVLDTSGGPRAGATVDFALTTTVGGLSISPTSAVSDANGQVQTIVNGGTQATTVNVKASTVAASGTTISTESNALTVSTGIPTSANISLSVKDHNPEAWNVDGVVVPVTVRMTDRFSNPVPDGTTANFQTTLGGIDASCQTGSDTPGSGSCTVNWVSKEPRVVNGNPFGDGTTDGRSPIMVTAVGEESFKDANGNGYFDAGDTVAWNVTDADNVFTSGSMIGQPKPWQDTQEPFLNEFEIYDASSNPLYVAGEPYIDFNSNGKHDGLNMADPLPRTTGDGLMQSALCQGSLCSTTGSSVAIFATNVIVLSGSTAVFTPAAGQTFHYGANSSLAITVTITDQNGQQMPSGTDVKGTLASTAGTLLDPSDFTWPSTAAPGGSTFTFIASAPSTPGSGTLSVQVKTPGGILSTAFYTVAP